MSRSRRRGSRALAGLLAALVPVLPVDAGPEADPPSMAPLPHASREAISMLHQGRFDAASSAFAEISRRRPGDPEGPLFEGLTIWWRLLDLPKNEKMQESLQGRLEEAIRRGEDLMERGDVQRGRVFAGTAYLLSAQTLAFGGSYLAAGRAARAGHELLEAALETDPRASDARFALGAYKYFAARLPWLVRFLRVFVRLPGGSIEEGLAALEDAAAGGRYFQAEALLLLAYVHSENEDDADLRLALGYLDRVRRVEPASPLLAAIEAKFLFEMGRLGQSERSAREAIELAAGVPGVAPAVPALARLRLAFALYYQYRPAEAMAAIEPLASSRDELTPEARSRMDGLLARLSPGAVDEADEQDDARTKSISAAPLPSDAAARAAIEALRSGSADEAAARLERAAALRPEDPVLRYHLARAYQVRGEHPKAERELDRLLAGGSKVPKTLRGWALLRMGAALEADGRKDQARSYYRQGSSLKGFVFRGAAQDRLKHPEEPFFPEG